MTENEALGMIWHMANMWLCEGTQRFEPNPDYYFPDESQDWLEVLLESHGVTSEGLVRITTEADAEEALSIIHTKYFKEV